jgi:hypothetical protein
LVCSETAYQLKNAEDALAAQNVMMEAMRKEMHEWEQVNTNNLQHLNSLEQHALGWQQLLHVLVEEKRAVCETSAALEDKCKALQEDIVKMAAAISFRDKFIEYLKIDYQACSESQLETQYLLCEHIAATAQLHSNDELFRELADLQRQFRLVEASEEIAVLELQLGADRRRDVETVNTSLHLDSQLAMKVGEVDFLRADMKGKDDLYERYHQVFEMQKNEILALYETFDEARSEKITKDILYLQAINGMRCLKDEVDVISAEISDKNVTIKSLTLQLQALTDSAAESSMRYSEAREESARLRMEIIGRDNFLQETLNDMDKAVSRSCNVSVELSKGKIALETQLRLIPADGDHKERVLTAYVGFIRQLISRLEGSADELSTLRREQIDSREDVEQYKSTVEVMSHAIKTGMQGIEKLNKLCEQAQSDNDALRIENANLIVAHNDYNDLIAKLSGVVKSSMAAVESLSAHATKLEKDIEMHREEHRILQADTDVIRATLVKSQQSEQDSQAEIVSLKNEIVTLSTGNMNLSAENMCLREGQRTKKSQKNCMHDDLLVFFNWDEDDILRIGGEERDLFEIILVTSMHLQTHFSLVLPECSTGSMICMSSTCRQVLFYLFSRVAAIKKLFEGYYIPQQREVALRDELKNGASVPDECAILLRKLTQESNIKARPVARIAVDKEVMLSKQPEIASVREYQSLPKPRSHRAATKDIIHFEKVGSDLPAVRRIQNLAYKHKSEKVHYDAINDATLLDEFEDIVVGPITPVNYKTDNGRATVSDGFLTPHSKVSESPSRISRSSTQKSLIGQGTSIMIQTGPLLSKGKPRMADSSRNHLASDGKAIGLADGVKVDQRHESNAILAAESSSAISNYITVVLALLVVALVGAGSLARTVGVEELLGMLTK